MIIIISCAAALLIGAIVCAAVFATLYFSREEPKPTQASTAPHTTEGRKAEPVREVTTQPATTEAPQTAPPQTEAPTTAPDATTRPGGYGENYTPPVPYLIRVKPVTVIYNLPSYDSGVAMTLDEENVYTIVAEQRTDGRLWGKFKSGVGWVCLEDIWENGGSLED